MRFCNNHWLVKFLKNLPGNLKSINVATFFSFIYNLFNKTVLHFDKCNTVLAQKATRRLYFSMCNKMSIKLDNSQLSEKQ